MVTMVQMLVERPDGSRIAEVIDGPDLRQITGQMVASDVWMALRDAAGRASGTRQISLRTAAHAISRERHAPTVLTVRRASVTEARLPRRLPTFLRT